MAEGTEQTPHTYPAGVPCWIELVVPDPDAAEAFYTGLFGWSVREAMPAGAGTYRVVAVRGKDAGAITTAGPGEPARWITYIAVDDADAAAARAAELGANVEAPQDAGPAGRYATLRDPQGAEVRLWQAGRRLGSQVNNAPGSWNFSDLHSTPLAAALDFYRALFGWEVADMGEDAEAIIRVPGYGDHLEATVDPEIRVRQAGAPEGFADAVAGAAETERGEPPHWHVVFSVADRDDAAATAERLGGAVLDRGDGKWARTATVRDPQGAVLTLSQFRPQAAGDTASADGPTRA